MGFTHRFLTLLYPHGFRVTDVPQAEGDALIWLYKHASGPSWTDHTNWLVTHTVADWYGVTVAGGHVTQVKLSSNGLNGNIGAFPVDQLPSLTVLWVGNNASLSGNISGWSLPAPLFDLYIYATAVSGDISSWILQTALRYLFIYSTSLTGAPDISNNSNMRNYNYSNCGLSQATVDAVLLGIYNQRKVFTYSYPLVINVGGTNAEPGGTYQDADPPTTGKEYIYELCNDPEAESFWMWKATYRDGAADVIRATIAIDKPRAYQVIQQDGAGQADIAINGWYRSGTPTAIEASWNGGAWTVIDAAPAGGTFSGTLAGQSAGQGTLSVRFANDVSITFSTLYVGIGDVFVVAGQSNAGVPATNAQSYSHATLKAGVYATHNDRWYELANTAYNNTFDKACWPLVATEFLDDQGVPVAFVPTAVGATTISQWQPGGAYYNAMVAQATEVGGIKAVLWQQGESDAIAGTAEATYNSLLDALANGVQASLGVGLMACKIHTCTTYTAENRDKVNNAIATAWGDNANVLQGPDFSAYTPDGNLHFETDADMQKQAGTGAEVGWWDAVEAEFYP